MLLDSIENIVNKASEWTKLHRAALRGGLGFVILFYGSHFPHLILLGHSASVAALPIIQQRGEELIDSYKRTRAAIIAQKPAIEAEGKGAVKHAEKLFVLKEKLSAAKKDYDAGKITPAEWKELSDDLTAEINAIQHSLAVFSNSFTAITNAIDVKCIQGILFQLYSAVMTHIATTSSDSVKAVTLGLSIGKIVGERLDGVVRSIIKRIKANNSKSINASEDDLNKWAVSFIHGTSHVVGVMASFFLERAAQVFSSCTLGSQLLLSSVQTLADPLLGELKLPTLASNPEFVTALQMALVGVGFWTQLRGSNLSVVAKAVLSPILAADLAITAFFVTKK